MPKPEHSVRRNHRPAVAASRCLRRLAAVAAHSRCSDMKHDFKIVARIIPKPELVVAEPRHVHALAVPAARLPAAVPDRYNVSVKHHDCCKNGVSNHHYLPGLLSVWLRLRRCYLWLYLILSQCFSVNIQNGPPQNGWYPGLHTPPHAVPPILEPFQ